MYRGFLEARHSSLLGCILATLLLAGLLAGCVPSHAGRIVVGSKNFTESMVLAEILAEQIEARTHLKVERRFYLAGSYICQQAIMAGRIDIYPEYTGTALTAILKEHGENKSDVYQRVRQEYETRFGLALGPPFGFNNTFALEIRGEDARRLQLTTLSQAAAYTPQWRAGFGYEFMERPDGFKGLAATYGLRFAAPPRIMDLGLLAPALKDHQIDIAAGNATDGLIPRFDLVVLQDDLHYFPPYEAVAVIRHQTLQQHPEVAQAIADLGSKITDQEMQKLNYALDGERREVRDVAHEFLRSKGLVP